MGIICPLVGIVLTAIIPSKRNFKISTLDEIFSHFGPLCGGGTAQERTATGRRGSKHGWVVTPATVGR